MVNSESGMIARLFNSLYYACWKEEAYISVYMVRKISKAVKLLALWLLPKKFKLKVLRSVARNYERTIQDYQDYEKGLYIRTVFESSFRISWSLFVMPSFMWVFLLMDRITKNNIVSIICGFVIVIICYKLPYKYVINDKRYLAYFKEFENNGAKWHKKWKIIAILFPIVSLLNFIFGTLWSIIIMDELFR